MDALNLSDEEEDILRELAAMSGTTHVDFDRRNAVLTAAYQRVVADRDYSLHDAALERDVYGGSPNFFNQLILPVARAVLDRVRGK